MRRSRARRPARAGPWPSGWNWTADVYAAVDRPNLNEPGKAAPLYEQALHIKERFAAAGRPTIARRASTWRRATANSVTRSGGRIPNALSSCTNGRSPRRRRWCRKSNSRSCGVRISSAISRPLIQLGRTAEARKALTENSQQPDRFTAAICRSFGRPFDARDLAESVVGRGQARGGPASPG